MVNRSNGMIKAKEGRSQQWFSFMTAKEQKLEHTSSYYAATINDHTRYPELKGTVKADVAIVGAGFTGVASALNLAEAGYSVALIEANRVGWGATGRNGGQLIHGISGEWKLAGMHGPAVEELMLDLRWRGNDIVIDRIAQYNIECDFKPGYLEVASRPRHVKWLEEEYESLVNRKHPYRYELLDREATQVAAGTEAYIGSLLTWRDGHLHPLNLCLGEARAATELGTQIFEQSPVTGIEHGDRPAVVTENGRVEAKQVILAGNAYHRLESRHLSGLTFPAGSYQITTSVLDEELQNSLNPQDVAICEMNEVLEYFRLTADGRMMFGGRCNYSGRDPKSIKAMIGPRMHKLYPALRNTPIEFEWGGKIGIVVNRIPALGRINGNVYYCQGYSGHGVNATHIMGEIMAQTIAGTFEKFDLWAGVKHIRIPGSQSFGNQMIALGMLYYRLKDLMP